MQTELLGGKLVKRLKLPQDLLVSEEMYEQFCVTAKFDNRPLKAHMRHIVMLGISARVAELGKETMRALLAVNAPNRTETFAETEAKSENAPESTESHGIEPKRSKIASRKEKVA